VWKEEQLILGASSKPSSSKLTFQLPNWGHWTVREEALNESCQFYRAYLAGMSDRSQQYRMCLVTSRGSSDRQLHRQSMNQTRPWCMKSCSLLALHQVVGTSTDRAGWLHKSSLSIPVSFLQTCLGKCFIKRERSLSILCHVARWIHHLSLVPPVRYMEVQDPDV
jgi:hypothetical protein